MPVSGTIESLHHAAEAYLALGYSVIPLHGEADPERAKVAVVEWKPYQTRKPRPDDLLDWFVQNRYGAIGIVTGRISGIAVLDLDSQRAYDLFCKTCPDLAEQHIIKTRRGYHIYFRIPPHLHLASRKVPEADWLADGRYVVARPTPGYKLIKGGEPKLLDADDLRRIEGFLGSFQSSPPLNPLPITWRGDFNNTTYLLATQWRGGQGVRTEQHSVLNPFNSALGTQYSALTPQSLTLKYRYLAAQIGRNEALFRVSLKARDHGWSMEDTITLLADLHAHQPSTNEHVPEREVNRRKEAVATIYSAFSRPARPVQSRQGRGLPVSVVEALLQLRLTCVIRVIAGLRAAGVDEGEPLTMPQMARLLRGRVGEWSIRAALDARFSNETFIFAPVAPSALPPVPDGTASHSDTTDYQFNASLIGCKNQQELLVRRPPTHYQLPSNADLLRRLDVKPSGGITLTADDLATARITRLAIHRELFARRPAQYPQTWQAARLGVSRRTIQAYNHLIPDLQIVPVFGEIRLSWANLNELPDDMDIKGAFLEDENGKHYPPLRAIAAKLLKQGRRLCYKRQEANYYCIASPQVMAVQRQAIGKPLVICKPRAVPPPKGIEPPPRNEGRAPVSIVPAGQPALPGFLPFQIVKQRPAPPKPPRPKRSSPRVYRKPLADSANETLAQQVYDTINARTTVKAERISLASARKYVDRYGSAAVERSLKLLARRRHIIKPVGFFATVVRSEAKFRDS